MGKAKPIMLSQNTGDGGWFIFGWKASSKSLPLSSLLSCSLAWGCCVTVTATAAVLFSTTIFLSGGIIGTFHHLYFSGTPIAVMAFGAVFSALEVVPLVLIGFEAYENLTLSRAKLWVSAYRWPIYCFVAVAFWNLVGAGLFGFLINPPIALYYMQGLNTTAVHGHTALFGVYGMLGIGLMLFCLKGLTVHRAWKTKQLAFAFWSINIGLALMVLLSDLPRGLMQTVASVNEGMWWARSAEFMQQGIMEVFRWLRGDRRHHLWHWCACARLVCSRNQDRLVSDR